MGELFQYYIVGIFHEPTQILKIFFSDIYDVKDKYCHNFQTE